MLSVDPAYEMYPGVSPFAYTLQNPVRYVDPTGMFVEDHEYSIDKQGNVRKEKHIEGSASDNLHTKENWDLGITDKGISVTDQSILNNLSKDDPNYIANSFWGKKIGAWSKTSNKRDAYKVFKFGSDNSQVEWGLEEYTNDRFLIGNNHFSEAVGSMTDVAGYNIKDLKRDYHSHLGTTNTDNQASGQMGDQGHASRIIQELLNQKIDYSNHPKFFIYMPQLESKFQYNPWNNKFNIKNVKNANDL